MKIFITMMIILIGLSGCSSIEKAIKTTPAEKENVDYTFEVNQDYQIIYQRLLEQAKACSKPQFTAKMVVKGKLLAVEKAADISVDMQGFFSSNSYLKVRIDNFSDNKSKVHVTNKWPKWNGMARAVKSWLMEGTTECETGASKL